MEVVLCTKKRVPVIPYLKVWNRRKPEERCETCTEGEADSAFDRFCILHSSNSHFYKLKI